MEYANLRYAKMIGVNEYLAINAIDILLLYGEYVFSRHAGFMIPQNQSNQYENNIADFFKQYNVKPGQYTDVVNALPAIKMRTEQFIHELAADILTEEPKLVGCTTCFQQNNASFAILKEIKKLSPATVTMIGGSNCAGQAGLRISKLPFIDYVFSGEADEVFAEMTDTIIHKEGYAGKDLPYGLIQNGRCPEEAPYRVTKNLNQTPAPDFGDYLECCDKREITPILLVEGSRGCWWRMKNPCAFCGLDNGAGLYRVKSSGRLLREIEEQARKYKTNNFCFTDCLLSREHITRLPELCEKAFNKNPSEYKLFCEIKSNVNKEALAGLKKAGFTAMQPGIESLHDDILGLMNKGGTAINHIAFLKHGRSLGIDMTWNILVGCPQEKPEWIREMALLFPKLSHLQAPAAVRHIIYQRNSTYHRRPRAYGLSFRPVRFYQDVYGNDEIFIRDIAYNFEPVDEVERGEYYKFTKKGPAYEFLLKSAQDWHADFYQNKDCLKMIIYNDRIELLDFRKIAQKNFITLQGITKDIYLLCDDPLDKDEILSRLTGRYTQADVADSLDFLASASLTVESQNKVLSLATVIGV